MATTVNVTSRTTPVLQLVLEIFGLVVKCLWSIAMSIYYTCKPPTEKSVKDEIVLVTGAGHGIGRALALKYASEGATVVCWDINKLNNEKTLHEIQALGYSKAYAYLCDITNATEVTEMAKTVQNEVGPVTILINNAGVAHIKTILESDAKDIENTFKVNAMAHFWTIKAFLPGMKRNNHGHIVAISSLAGLYGGRNGTSYCASKFAVRGMMEALYQELRVDRNCKIECTTIYPAGVETGIFKSAVSRFRTFLPLITPKEAADYIVRAQRQNQYAFSIPLYNLCINKFINTLPISAQNNILDFIDTYITE